MPFDSTICNSPVMDLIRRTKQMPARLAVFPGTYNPPTQAHLALAEAALQATEEVLFVLPRTFPHKPYSGASMEQRLDLLLQATSEQPLFSIGTSEGGLFIDIARECREHYPAGTELLFLCGRDAAERVVTWDYGDPQALPLMLNEFRLLVARRGSEYEPPPDVAERVVPLILELDWDEVSATTVRDRIAAGADWQHLVPSSIVAKVQAIYGR
ncbi:MAG: adenylyltransferase/cytidyltransferase family protein [Bryobacteraceae bacterium]